MKLFTISLLTLLVFSCTITKRRVLPGYHINWGKHELSQHKENIQDTENNESDSYFLKVENNIENQKTTISTSTCDTIRLQDGSVILGKIISLDSKIIEYKSCQDESSFIYKIYKSTIKSISYANGVVYNHTTETEITEKRKQLEEKRFGIDTLTDEEHKIIYQKRSKKVLILMFISFFATISQALLLSPLFLPSFFIFIFSIFYLNYLKRKISKYDKIPKKDKIIEKDGRNSILLFFLALICVCLALYILSYLWMPMLLVTLAGIDTIALISSFVLAIKSLKIISKNPDRYKLKGLISFIAIIDTLMLLAAVFVFVISFFV